MKRLIKSYFTFNKTERRGTFVLSLIIVLLVFFNFLLPHLFPSEKIDFTAFEKEIDSFKAVQASYNDSIENSKNNYRKKRSVQPESLSVTYFDFDPNNLSDEKWRQLGLNEYQIRTINNYQNKGGKFYKKEDMKDIYGISPELYASLEPFMVIPIHDKKFSSKGYENPNNSETPIIAPVVELNAATAYILTTLKDVGVFYSGNIIKYRDRLGGFIKKEQLLEVYGIDSSLYESISNQTIIDETILKKLNINKCSIYDLKKHPYIKNHIAISIVNYREQHGQYKEISEIKKSDLVNEELYLKLAPYLTVE